MNVTQTALEGVLLIEPRVFRDQRGFFLETYHEEKYRSAGVDATFVQDNQSSSARGTLRGLHAQRQRPQGKLVRAIQGEIWDVAVDARPGSPTCGRWAGFALSSENFLQLWVPPGFLHGFCVTSETAQVEYKCTDFYLPTDEIGVIWNDPGLAIEWPVDSPIVSGKDSKLPTFSQLASTL